MSVSVFISTVANGSMYNPYDHRDPIVIANREKYFRDIDVDINTTTRLNTNILVRATIDNDTDYCRYEKVSILDQHKGMRDEHVVVADAIVTTDKGHALFLPLADCVGAAFYDTSHHVLLLSHLGRHSLEQQGGVAGVQYLVDKYGSDPADIEVWLTPAPSKESYKIWALDNKGMKEVTFEQLLAAGITPEHIHDNTAETDKDSHYYSYTEYFNGRSDDPGRHAIVAMITD